MIYASKLNSYARQGLLAKSPIRLETRSGHRHLLSRSERSKLSKISAIVPPIANQPTSSDSILGEYLSSSLRIIGPHISNVEDDQSEARAVGAFVGALCGNCLGSLTVSERAYKVPFRFPNGITAFHSYDFGEEPMRYGQHDGNFSTLLATGRSVVAEKGVDSNAIAREMLFSLEPELLGEERRYPPYARLIIENLRTCLTDIPLADIPRLAAFHLAATSKSASQITGDRQAFDYKGPDDNGGVARILPVAWAYLSSSEGLMDQAVRDALVFTHTESAVDSARVFSAAISWLSKQASPVTLDGSESSWARDELNVVAKDLTMELLAHLSSVARTQEMSEKLILINSQSQLQLPRIDSWKIAFKTDEWSRLLILQNSISHKGTASYGVEAVAAALLAFCSNIASGPKQAVITSASFAGSGSSVVSQLTGALCGSLFGDEWIPTEWTDNLEGQSFEQAIQMAKSINRIQEEMN